MFTDIRCKKIVFVCHCILNQNSISDGTADYPAINEAVVRLLIDSKVGIVQLPCPEFNCLGLDRGNMNGANNDVIIENSRIRDSMSQTLPWKTMNELVNQVVFQMKEYINYGFAILGVVGSNRSPSCGIDTTSANNCEVEGEGVFMKSLIQSLRNQQIAIPFVGIRALETEESIRKIKELILKEA